MADTAVKILVLWSTPGPRWLGTSEGKKKRASEIKDERGGFALVVLSSCFSRSLFFFVGSNYREPGTGGRVMLRAEKIRELEQVELRWLKTVSSTFQDTDFDGSLQETMRS